jgi:holo-[acyl-carrier protein] synthase
VEHITEHGPALAPDGQPAGHPPRPPAPPLSSNSLIIGVGVDIVETSRIERILAERGERFRTKLFTPEEIAYCDAMAKPLIHYAARFAAKEAFSKALGTGIARGVKWKDVGVVHRPGGQPALVITGRAAELLRELGAGSAHVSLSHTDGHAAASVAIERDLASLLAEAIRANGARDGIES